MIAQNYFWHYAVVMGENGTDDLSYEDYVAEDYAGGTDSSRYYNDNQLYDIDEQPEPNSQLSGGSSQDDVINEIINNGNGADAFDNMVNRDNDQNDNDDVGGGEYGKGGSTVGDDDFDSGEEKEKPDNFDGEDDADDSDDDDEDEEDDDDDEVDGAEDQGDEQGDGESTDGNNQGKKGKKHQEKKEKFIKWKKGNPITLPLLQLVWKGLEMMKFVGGGEINDLIAAANAEVIEMINFRIQGPGIMFILNRMSNVIKNPKLDAMGSLLELSNNFLRRLKYTAVAGTIGLFSQQWQEARVIYKLRDELADVIMTNPLKRTLNDIFKTVVPLINKSDDIISYIQSQISMAIE